MQEELVIGRGESYAKKEKEIYKDRRD